jgi:2-dehydropantoate 2-reductase
MRSDYEVVKRAGIRVESVAGDFHLEKARCFRSVEEIGPVDLVVVAWKATANDGLAGMLGPLMHEETRVLTLQNGLGNCELIAELAGDPGRVLGGLCFVCLNRLNPGFVRHSGGGRVTVGAFGADPDDWAGEVAGRMAAAGVDATFAPDLEAAQWKKLIWNVPFNGLAIAEGGVNTEEILGRLNLEGEVRALMGEVVDAAEALGFSLDRGLIDLNVDLTRPMGDYRPSSMIDFMEGREVEVEAIWGEPVRRAKAAGAEVPRMERLLGRIRERLAQRSRDAEV